MFVEYNHVLCFVEVQEMATSSGSHVDTRLMVRKAQSILV